jgi:preprotein translocase subunit SecA
MSSSGSTGDAHVRAEVADFLSSHHAARFKAFERKEVATIARAFLEACYVDLGLRPDLVDQEHLREALLEVLPRRLDPHAPMSARAPEVVRALLDHHFEEHSNPNAWSLDPVFDEAKGSFAGLLESGGGREKRAEKPETIERPGSKLGRNDPCPCGSGKKYKKCCGANS